MVKLPSPLDGEYDKNPITNLKYWMMMEAEYGIMDEDSSIGLS